MTQETLPATIEAPNRRNAITVIDSIPLYDTAKFEHMQRIATVMAKASIIPDALKGNSPEQTLGNCFLVVNQAFNWQMDPSAVAQCTSVVYGKLCFEGKLIAAVIETKLGVRLRYEWFGEPGTDSYGIRISHPDFPEQKIEGTVGEWKTTEKDNKTTKANWRGNAATKQLKYRGDREWCRMWAPALMLGVYSDDELEDLSDDARARRAIPAGGSGLAARLTGAGEGFNHDAVRRELGASNEGGDDGVTVASTGTDNPAGATRSDRGAADTSGEDGGEKKDNTETEADPKSGQAGESPATKSKTEARLAGDTPDVRGAGEQASETSRSSDVEPSGKEKADRSAQKSSGQAEGTAKPDSSQGESDSGGAGKATGGGGAENAGSRAAAYDYRAYSNALGRATKDKSLKQFDADFRNRNAWTTEDKALEILRRIYGLHLRRLKGDLSPKDLDIELQEILQ